MWFHSWTTVLFLPRPASARQHLSSVRVHELGINWGSLGLLRQVCKASSPLSNPYFPHHLGVSFLLSSLFVPLSTFVSLLWIQMYFKTLIQYFYFCSEKDCLVHFLVRKDILNVACCFLKANIINKEKAPFHCKLFVNIILTEICLTL